MVTYKDTTKKKDYVYLWAVLPLPAGGYHFFVGKKMSCDCHVIQTVVRVPQPRHNKYLANSLTYSTNLSYGTGKMVYDGLASGLHILDFGLGTASILLEDVLNDV